MKQQAKLSSFPHGNDYQPHRGVYFLGVLFFVFITFLGVKDHGFINYDDPSYITENPNVNTGLSVENVKWAAVSLGDAYMWHPLTYISHQIDVSLFGLNPLWHHLANAGWHSLAAALLFLIASQLTGSRWMGILMALIWAVHPEKVQSVAWLSERKDVLSGAFFFASVYCFMRWKTREDTQNIFYVLSLIFCIVAMLSKPSVIPLPLILFILFYAEKNIWKSIRKASQALIPFVIVSVAVAIITIYFQRNGVHSTIGEQLQPRQKILQIIHSYTFYIVRFFYAEPAQIWFNPISSRLGGIIPVVIFVVFACGSYWLAKREKMIMYGLIIYSVLWLPVSGIVTVSYYYIADRYSYLPQLGLIIMLLGLAKLVCKSENRVLIFAGAASLMCFCMSLLFFQQRHIPLWKNDDTLFTHEMKINPESLLAPVHFARIYEESDPEKSLTYYRKARAIDPEAGVAITQVGIIQYKLGDKKAALESFQQGVNVTTPVKENWTWLLKVQSEMKLHDQARQTIDDALERFPQYYPMIKNAGIFYTGNDENPQKGLEYFLRAHELQPNDMDVIRGCVFCYSKLGMLEEAKKFQKKLPLDQRN